jgi:hypothetical protein
MPAKGANPYDVAKLLGDTVATVEMHYAPFVKELRHRARKIMENGEGLAKTDCRLFTRPVTVNSESIENRIVSSGRACKPDSVPRALRKKSKFTLGDHSSR